MESEDPMAALTPLLEMCKEHKRTPLALQIWDLYVQHNEHPTKTHFDTITGMLWARRGDIKVLDMCSDMYKYAIENNFFPHWWDEIDEEKNTYCIELSGKNRLYVWVVLNYTVEHISHRLRAERMHKWDVPHVKFMAYQGLDLDFVAEVLVDDLLCQTYVDAEENNCTIFGSSLYVHQQRVKPMDLPEKVVKMFGKYA